MKIDGQGIVAFLYSSLFEVQSTIVNSIFYEPYKYYNQYLKFFNIIITGLSPVFHGKVNNTP